MVQIFAGFFQIGSLSLKQGKYKPPHLVGLYCNQITLKMKVTMFPERRVKLFFKEVPNGPTTNIPSKMSNPKQKK